MDDLHPLGDTQYEEATTSYTHKRRDSLTEEQDTLLERPHAYRGRRSAKGHAKQFLSAGKDIFTAGVQKAQLPKGLIRRMRSRTSGLPFSAGNMQQPTSRREWFMLCLDGKRPPMAVHQTRLFVPPTSNEEFFRCLAREYEDRRESYTFGPIEISPFWLYVKAIHFVRFRTLGSSQPNMTAQIEEAHSLPHLGAQNWIWNGEDGIAPAAMAEFLIDPVSAGTGWSVYDYVPRVLCPLPPRDGVDGWGLYVQEGVSWGWISVCVVVVVLVAFFVRGLGGG
jgi:hypothetical protein